MEEYMDILRIDDWDNLSIIDDDGCVKYVYDIGELPRADVVERSLYDEVYKDAMKFGNAWLKEREKHKQLKKNINKSIKEMKELINHSKLPTVNMYNKYSDGLKDCLDILKRNIGE